MKIWVNKLGINVDVVSVDEALQTGSEEIGRVLPDDLDPRIEKEIEGVGRIYAESTKTGFCLIYVRYADDPPVPLMVYCLLCIQCIQYCIHQWNKAVLQGRYQFLILHSESVSSLFLECLSCSYWHFFCMFWWLILQLTLCIFTCDLLYDLMQMGALVRQRLEEMSR